MLESGQGTYLFVREAEGVPQLSDLDGLEDPAVLQLALTRQAKPYLLQRVLALEQQLALLVVGLHAADVLALRRLQDGDEVVQLLVELGAHGGLQRAAGLRREEGGDEVRRR